MIRAVTMTSSLSRRAGGLFDAVRRLSQELARTPMDLSVLGTWDESTEVDLAAWNPLPVKVAKTVGPRQFGYSPISRSVLNQLRPDLLHTHGLWSYSSLLASSYSRRNNIPHIVSPHGMLDPWALKNSAWKKRCAYLAFEKSHLQNAACLHALSQSEAKSFRKLGLKNPIAIIPNGVDLPGGEAYQKSDSLKRLLFLGRLHPKKGLANAVRAFAQAVRKHPAKSGNVPWQFVIAGWDQNGHREELKKLCQELDLNIVKPEQQNSLGEIRSIDSMVFLDPVFGKEKDDLLRSVDACILPSLSEGLPMAVLEAWAYRLPVIMTPECNLPEGFAVNAALKIEGTTEGITAGLHALFAMNSDDLRETGVRGRKLVEDHFSWNSRAAEMAQVYHWILEKKTLPDTLHFLQQGK